MDTFPAIEPVYSVAEETNPLVKKNAFGDGYLQSIRFGLNFIKPDWNLQWLVSKAEASTIELFLKQQSEDGKWFYWTPPDSSSAVKWRCDEWTIEDLADSLVRIDATFRQVFELSSIDIDVLPGSCGGGGDGSITQNGTVLTYTPPGVSSPQFITWYLTDCATGTQRTAVASGIDATYTITAATFASGSGTCVIATAVPTSGPAIRRISSVFTLSFIPELFAYARAIRTGFYVTEAVPAGPPVTGSMAAGPSPWFALGDGINSKYWLGLDGTVGTFSIITVVGPAEAKWRGYLSVEFFGPGSNLLDFGKVAYNRELPSPTNVSVALFDQRTFQLGYLFGSRQTTGIVYEIFVTYEFSNDANTVLATWDGYRN
jgi:phage-related protein